MRTLRCQPKILSNLYEERFGRRRIYSRTESGKASYHPSHKATIVANSDSLKDKITERILAENLPPEWKEWAEENNKYIDNAGVKQLELVTLEFKNSVYSKVFILEKGSLVKFIDLSPNRYTFKWGDNVPDGKKSNVLIICFRG